MNTKNIQSSKWHSGMTVYQIYPRSFRDSSGDGIGDLRGIIDKLDYLRGSEDSLGVDAIWISPIYTSPMADFGYDVANYTDVDPIFGNIDDIKELIKEAHERGICVMLDFVPNHSSDEHPWFIESKSSIDNPKRDWYIWHRPTPDGNAPNNWLSVFNGPAWEFSKETGQYYLHSFLSKQPDLNWSNPDVRQAMKEAMRFWLDLGIDGFRVDAVEWISKDSQFRDDPINENFDHPDKNLYNSLTHTYSRGGPNLYKYLNELTEVLAKYDDKFMVIEGHPESNDQLTGYLKYYESVNANYSAPFNFKGIHLPWNAYSFREFIDRYQAAMLPHYVPIYTLGNHDESRLASRFGKRTTRTAAMLLLTLPGMPFIYYGEEIGLEDVPIDNTQIKDPFTEPGKGRDPSRTPMQWSDEEFAGFSTTKPWLPVSENFQSVNVEVQSKDDRSILSLYKKLLRLRSSTEALRIGSYKSFDLSNDDVFCFQRCSNGQSIFVVLNFSDQTQQVLMPVVKGRQMLSTTFVERSNEHINNLKLDANEGVIIEVIK